MQIWKRNAVVSVIVLFVCVALYLSWSYGREPEEELPVFDPAAGLGAETLSGDGTLIIAGGEDPSSLTEPVNTYFDEARLSRRKARDTALSILTDAVEREGVSQEIRDNASTEIAKMAQNALMEANIENLIIAKGFAECVAIINQDGISIVVAEPVDGMTSTDAAMITDIVVTESAIQVADIKIVHVGV
ncbi:MAG: SpoIIIAH-like family protein [Oscillospiraceae bacterium]|jgi:stage III sporulation protein AH|nr:SpoIIIAH-like family protein [Oscillospiraceae bacterium]